MDDPPASEPVDVAEVGSRAPVDDGASDVGASEDGWLGVDDGWETGGGATDMSGAGWLLMTGAGLCGVDIYAGFETGGVELYSGAAGALDWFGALLLNGAGVGTLRRAGANMPLTAAGRGLASCILRPMRRAGRPAKPGGLRSSP
ncbi:MAG: hypothetical protein V3V15_01345 [Sphingorhabdus sp.]